MKSTPFRRALMMMQALANAMSIGNVLERRAALDALGPYKSRGKGKGGRQASRRTVAQDKRAARKARNVARHKAALRG